MANTVPHTPFQWFLSYLQLISLYSFLSWAIHLVTILLYFVPLARHYRSRASYCTVLTYISACLSRSALSIVLSGIINAREHQSLAILLLLCL